MKRGKLTNAIMISELLPFFSFFRGDILEVVLEMSYYAGVLFNTESNRTSRSTSSSAGSLRQLLLAHVKHASDPC
jgi:hypothetical protein